MITLEVRCDAAGAPSQFVADQVRQALAAYRHAGVIARDGELTVTVEVGPPLEMGAAVDYAVAKIRARLDASGLTECPVTVFGMRPL